MRNVVAITIASTLMGLAPGTSVGAEAELPNGWRLLNSQELADPFGWRKESPHKYTKVAADFNDDGIDDIACLAMHVATHREGLLMKLSVGKSRFEWLTFAGDESQGWKRLSDYKIGPAIPPDPYHTDVGIDLLEPGKHTFHPGAFCLDKDCTKEKLPPLEFAEGGSVVVTRYPALSYFYWGKSSRFFHWDKKAKTFFYVWTSD